MSQQDQPDFSIPTLGPISKDSRLSYRSVLENNGDVYGWANSSGLWRRGKFFPRGCRGFIYQIEVYCRDVGVGGGTITVYITPAVGIGQFYNANIVVPPAGVAAWRAATFNIMWEYDSLFVFCLCSNVNIEIAWDLGTPYDMFYTTDGEVTWLHYNDRQHIRVVMRGETAGDVPVSGTINNIPIPNVSSPRVYQVFNLNNNLETDVVNLYGAGEVEYIWAEVSAAVLSESTEIRIYCDGLVSWDDVVGGFGVIGFTANTPKISQIRAAMNGACDLLLSVKFCFRRHLRITAQRAVGAGAITGFIAGVFNLVR